MNDNDRTKQWAKIVAKAWADGDFKKRLLADPTAVLKAEGIEVPAGITLKVIENSETTIHLVLPAMPKSADGFQSVEARLAALPPPY